MAETSATADTFSVAKISSADTAALLERLNVSGLVEDGALNVIGLEAIRQKFGDRWPRKQEDVWAYVERAMAKHLSPRDVFHRLNDTEFLIATMEEGGVGGQAVCMHILEEVLVYFMGGCKQSDMALRTVRSIRGGEIDCAEVDVAAAVHRQKVFKETTPEAAPATRHPTLAMPLLTVVTSSGRELRITHAPEQLCNLRYGVASGVRGEPIVVDVLTGDRLSRAGFLRLADSDLARIDRATLEMGVAVARMVPQSKPGIIMPLSFQSLSSARARSALFAGIPADVIRARFLIEITNIEPGTPNGRLIETAALLKAHTTGVLARISPGRDALRPLADCRFAGVALDLSDMAEDEAALLTQMAAFQSRALGLSPSLQVLGLLSKAMFGAAQKIGFTHASVRRPLPVSLAA